MRRVEKETDAAIARNYTLARSYDVGIMECTGCVFRWGKAGGTQCSKPDSVEQCFDEVLQRDFIYVRRVQ